MKKERVSAAWKHSYHHQRYSHEYARYKRTHQAESNIVLVLQQYLFPEGVSLKPLWFEDMELETLFIMEG